MTKLHTWTICLILSGNFKGKEGLCIHCCIIKANLSPQPFKLLPTFLLKGVGGLVLGYVQLLILIDFLNHFLLYGEGRKRDFNGCYVFQADAFGDGASGKFFDFPGVGFILENVVQIFA